MVYSSLFRVSLCSVIFWILLYPAQEEKGRWSLVRTNASGSQLNLPIFLAVLFNSFSMLMTSLKLAWVFLIFLFSSLNSLMLEAGNLSFSTASSRLCLNRSLLKTGFESIVINIETIITNTKDVRFMFSFRSFRL